jgi:hypothetical protein
MPAGLFPRRTRLFCVTPLEINHLGMRAAGGRTGELPYRSNLVLPLPWPSFSVTNRFLRWMTSSMKP